jgi:hypothetical protein
VKETPALRKAIARYTSSHWGNKPDKIIHITDELIPTVTMMGKLLSIYLTLPDNSERELKFLPDCILAFDPNHKFDRLYLVICDDMREQVRALMKHVPHGKLATLQKIAKVAGGKQSLVPLPDIKAFPMGVCTNIIYHANKKGDGPSDYIHEYGEETNYKHLPILAADVSGRLWLCGGSYTVPDPGITD